MDIKDITGRPLVLTPYLTAKILHHVQTIRRIVVRRPHHVEFVLPVTFFRVTFVFDDDYDFIDFIYAVSILQRRNPFHIAYPQSATFRANLRRKFMNTSPALLVAQYPTEIAYAQSSVKGFMT